MSGMLTSKGIIIICLCLEDGLNGGVVIDNARNGGSLCVSLAEK